MATSETETVIKLNKDEIEHLKSSIKKLTDLKIGFNKANLTDDETKIIDFFKSI